MQHKQAWSQYKHAITLTITVTHGPTQQTMAIKTMFKDWKKWKEILSFLKILAVFVLSQMTYLPFKKRISGLSLKKQRN